MHAPLHESTNFVNPQACSFALAVATGEQGETYSVLPT